MYDHGNVIVGFPLYIYWENTPTLLTSFAFPFHLLLSPLFPCHASPIENEDLIDKYKALCVFKLAEY